jgi:chitosanase
MRRHIRRRFVVRSASIAAVVMSLGIVGFSVAPRHNTIQPTELTHRDHRLNMRGHAQSINSDGYSSSQWLHVASVQDTSPSANPTAVVDATTNSSPDTQPAATDLPTGTTTPDQSSTLSTPQQNVSVAAPERAPAVAVTTPTTKPAINVPAPSGTDLTNPTKKDIAMQLVSSAENSSLNWKDQYVYLEDIGDGRGYTGGVIGFCSGTGDMLELIQHYTKLKPSNPLAKYLPALQKVDGSDSHDGLGSGFEAAWKSAAADPAFQQAQNDERDRVYFNPAVDQAKKDGLRALGQFIYYDALVMHGPGDDSESFGGIRAAAMKHAKTPAQGGDEATYLNAFLDARVKVMQQEAAHDDISRVEDEQRVFLNNKNFDLNTPLSWKTYGDSYKIQ